MAAPGWRTHEEGRLGLRVVLPVGGAAAFAHAHVTLDELMVCVGEHHRVGDAYVEARPDEAEGHRVEGAADRDVAVRGDLGRLPGSGLKGTLRQGQEVLGLEGGEDRRRLGARERAGAALPGHGE